MEVERKRILDAIESKTNKSKTLDCIAFPTEPEVFDKDLEKSVTARKLGNDLYYREDHSQKIHEDIWKHYCQSIAFAPNDSEELAVGYANRSALLLHLSKYEDSLKDIQRALEKTKSCALKVKLFCREAECCVALQEGKQSSSLEKAKYWLNKVDDDCQSSMLNKMIKKAQQVVENNVPSCPEKKEMNELNCDNNSVDIGYSDRYGRCLIANRDIQTGEFVYIEKCYVNSVNTSKLYAYCSHCLAISWALIPCDQCAYYMYCGKRCKDEAWEKYHDVECHMKTSLHLSFWTHCMRLSIRALIMGIKEAGSVENLKILVDELEKRKVKTRGILQRDQFSASSFESLYGLCSAAECVLEINQANVAITAAGLLLHVLDSDDNSFFDDDTILGKDMIFLGSLILRLFSVSRLNAFHVLQSSEGCNNPNETFPNCFVHACCSRGMNISLFTSLINHSCDSNVGKLYTNDGRVAYYAVKPIKKYSQIFSSYYFDFTLAPKNRREFVLFYLFKFKWCGCLACNENWPDITKLRIQQKSEYSGSIKKILKKYKKFEKHRSLSKKSIDEIIKELDQSLKNTTKPTIISTELRCIFVSMMENHYSDKLKIPEKCKDQEVAIM